MLWMVTLRLASMSCHSSVLADASNSHQTSMDEDADCERQEPVAVLAAAAVAPSIPGKVFAF